MIVFRIFVYYNVYIDIKLNKHTLNTGNVHTENAEIKRVTKVVDGGTT